ncbi:translation initiation factor IF-2 [Flavobacterium sp.]|jgi:translation initiation factor IF-2|uniref:translation initiation factor IF-2 n=1 Tax=Flavobacterium sp. TaxID=239 RepID=UPI0037BF0516
MSEERVIRISKVLKEFNISLDRAVDTLKEKGHTIEHSPNAKVSQLEFDVLCNIFSADKGNKVASKEVGEEKKKEKEALKREIEKELEVKRIAEEERQKQEIIKAKTVVTAPVSLGKIDLNPKKQETIKTDKPVGAKDNKDSKVEKTVVAEKTSDKLAETSKKSIEKTKVKSEEPSVQPQEFNPDGTPIEVRLDTQYTKLSGATFTGQTIDLAQFNKPKKKKEEFKKPGTPGASSPKPGTPGAAGAPGSAANKRKRIVKPATPNTGGTGGTTQGGFVKRPYQGGQGGGGFKKPGFNKSTPIVKVEPTEEEVKNQIKETLERLQGKGNKSKAAKYRRDKRDTHRQRTDDDLAQQDLESKILKVTEFVTVGEIATMMDVPITKVIGTCMSLGIMVTMNQRLDAETLTIVADEFGYEMQFITTDIEENAVIIEDTEEELEFRAPIVTVMGHVDHGKTSLLDYVRKANVIAGESGGITQHIGAYGVTLDGGQKIAFLDTPGHEAFTAMRARGAQVTDIAIIVVAADDDIMPQTKEAISHAQAAGVPMIFAINKVDKPNANPEKIKEQLAGMNLLVEDWGGKYQSHDISAKFGQGIPELLEKVLLEAEILELKANPNKPAQGTVVEAQLDKGRGYVSTILVQAGTLKIGDYMLAGKNHGKIRAMFDERGNTVKIAGPSTPVSVLGLDGAPTAGDKFNVYEDEREAKQIATKRAQLAREQSVRTQKHITLSEIGRRIALGQFKELNIILKGDVDGSVEALSDSFSKLSTEEIQINIIHKGVGAITESDVLLASASDAIIIGFNVRPAGNAKALADKEEIDIRNYSIIYAAIDDLKDAMEGMLSPELKEEITGTAEIRELFKVSKIGTIAGCMITDGKVIRNNRIRLIREGVVIFTGELVALKRFKDDVKEVAKGYDCGMQIKGYNDIKELDIIESFHEIEIKKKLK